MNKVSSEVGNKQPTLFDEQGNLIDDTAVDYDTFMSSIYQRNDTVENYIGLNVLVSANALAGGIDYVLNEMDTKRVEIYTTWDDDTEKAQVAFVTASEQQ